MERIYVTVRARPLSPEEAKSSPWRISGNTISAYNQSFKFEFDRIFGEECKTNVVYEARTKEIVGAAVCGFNGTVFAYGQTNSGKTHTMRGSAIEPGVIPLAVQDLFDIIQKIIESRDKAEDEDLGNTCDAVRVSVLNLVDLAGSERAAKTGAEGVRLKEGSHINKSLMTLGTVIKKLSEGAESQGGHVPYRDSKLTRILQPALGGNANTAIICNITLAQIHADETKSSLQFASRALRVTNCARVNEILTDAALLKRQKKEIEELRAKLKASHSEHLEEEILNLRNTLLQTELERERIALELEEEKRAQLEREKRLQEQAKKIKNLSSMVLYSNRDETHDHHKRGKRRGTWCPGNLTRETSSEASTIVESKTPVVGSMRAEREVGPLLPFEELVNGSGTDANNCCNLEEKSINTVPEDRLPDPSILLNVTNRRKVLSKKKSSPLENTELLKHEAEYQDLLLQFETQRIMYDVQIECLKRKLADADVTDYDRPTHLLSKTAFCAAKNTYSRELEQSNSDYMDQLVLEVQQTLTEVQSLRTWTNSISSFAAELQQGYSSTLHLFSNFKLSLCQSSLQLKASYNDYEKLNNLLKYRVVELENEKIELQTESADQHDHIQGLVINAQNSEKALAELAEQHDLEKAEFLSQIQILKREVLSLSSSSLSREKESLRKELEKTRTKLKETEFKLKNAVQEKTRLEGEKANTERENKKLHSQKAFLERDISRRESLVGRRRDSAADRMSKAFDIKRTRGLEDNFQQTLQEDYKKLEVLAFEMETTIASLEEDLSKANQEKEEFSFRIESLSSELEVLSDELNALNAERSMLHEENLGLRLRLEKSEASHEKLEGELNLLVEGREELAMQLTDAILELEEERAIWSAKEKASVEAIREKADIHNGEVMSLTSKISKMNNEMLSLREEFKALQERLKCAEENAEWETKSSMEKSLEIDRLKHELKAADIDNGNSQEVLNAKLGMLSVEHNHACDQVSKLQVDLSRVSEEKDKLLRQVEEYKRNSNLSNELQICKDAMRQEREKLMTQVEELQSNIIEMEFLRKSYDDKLLNAKYEVEELAKRCSDLEVKMHNDEVKNGKERAKLMMRLRSTQAKLDAFRERYREAVDEQSFMNGKFEEASTQLKKRLASYATEVLNLKKQLSAANIHSTGMRLE
ncbi:hypothetical protein Nepgr_009967 [Nepenthes gracilis]|uniref:Kinesin motor domain-containing protein n=1 Tax=Nepenthes gracilis TaxID=150966 RepID=A0AAD3XKM4_NEPGR|nr:hypothetical protein Nepgr_009967 [Nepenthes gracilis]